MAINERLTKYLDNMGIIGDEQAGFRKNYSTMDHIFVISSLINLYKHKGKIIYCAFIDYKKAFDLIDRSKLWMKLVGYGINGKLMTVIHNMYLNAKACVKLNSKISPLFKCNLGVRQGDSLSPLLFALYINDFELYLSRRYEGLKYSSSLINEILSDDDIELFIKIFVLLYADDTVVLAESPGELQKALNAVYEYCKMWKLQLNTSKTKIVIFSKGKVRKYPTFKYNNETIEVVDDYVYLGVTINFNGKFEKAMKKQVTQASRALCSLKTKRNKFRLPLDLYLDLFDKTIMPILLYGCEVWGHEKTEMLDIFYKKFIKNALHLHKYTTDCMVYGETGTKPISVHIQQRLLIFWHRLATEGQNKLSNILYNLQRNIYPNENNYTSPWLDKIKYLLNECGLSYIWENPSIIDNHTFKIKIKSSLDEIFRLKWLNDTMENNHCRIYRIFKTNLNLENYLVKLDLHDRINLCKFRCSNSRIPTVAGRYNNIEYEHRICSLCNMGDIGDEYHYTMLCPYFKNDRKKLIDSKYWTNPNIDKLSYLFSSENVKILKNLAKFAKNVTEKFKQIP